MKNVTKIQSGKAYRNGFGDIIVVKKTTRKDVAFEEDLKKYPFIGNEKTLFNEYGDAYGEKNNDYCLKSEVDLQKTYEEYQALKLSFTHIHNIKRILERMRTNKNEKGEEEMKKSINVIDESKDIRGEGKYDYMSELAGIEKLPDFHDLPKTITDLIKQNPYIKQMMDPQKVKFYIEKENIHNQEREYFLVMYTETIIDSRFIRIRTKKIDISKEVHHFINSSSTDNIFDFHEDRNIRIVIALRDYIRNNYKNLIETYPKEITIYSL